MPEGSLSPGESGSGRATPHASADPSLRSEWHFDNRHPEGIPKPEASLSPGESGSGRAIPHALADS
ncbi:MAG: hypothetical protein ABJD11_17405, partial [Gemmatimonadota bacterium]